MCGLENKQFYETIKLNNSFADIEIKNNSIHIEYIESKKKGEGKILINEIIKYAKKHKCKRITLTTNFSVVGFFKKMGFNIIDDKNKYDINMELSL